ncbi:unnamed protein product [Allacma fusca]|uniref:Uncharacterized protein n=1 Tax=Allacma fusca TaxID=39272 RepID=A0A8J2J0P8_9HEXA|nr:unnamed protein product [Allacma fusca]
MIVIIILVSLLSLPGAFGWNFLQNIVEKHFGSFYQESVDLVHLTGPISVAFNYYDVPNVYKNFPRTILPAENYTCPKAWPMKFHQGKFLVLADVKFFPETLQAARNSFIMSFASPLNTIYIFILPSSLIDSSQETLDFQLFFRKHGSGALVTVKDMRKIKMYRKSADKLFPTIVAMGISNQYQELNQPLDYILKCLVSSGISNLWEGYQVDRALAVGQTNALKWLSTKPYYNGEGEHVDDSWMFSLLLMQVLLLGSIVGIAGFTIELIIAGKYKLIRRKTRVEIITDQNSKWVKARLYISWEQF